MPVIGHVGHFADHKGHRYLVEAVPAILRRFPDIKVVLVGEGELRSEVEAQVNRLGIVKSVIFTGFRTDISSILASFDLFVLPSHLEGLCTSVMDAMAVGLPVVATRTGGVPEVVEDGETGLLVPPRDPDALADGVLRMLNDPGLRYRMGQAGRRRVLDHFSADAMVEGTENIYYEILKKKGAPRDDNRAA